MQSHHQQPPQPPKQAAYNQPTNPVTHTPSEQRAPQSSSQNPAQYDHLPRHRGDALSPITRNAASQPSNSNSNSNSSKHQESMRNAASTLDTEYGVEQQTAEGDIARAVQGKSADARARAQAGAHAGAVGSAEGPGAPGYEKGEMADLDQKREMHDRMLGDRVGQSPAEPEGEGEEVRRRKLRQDEEVDVVGAASRGSKGRVV